MALDEDVHQLALHYASARGITLGAAIGELVRAGRSIAKVEISHSPNGLPLFPRRNRVITAAMVREALEEEVG